MLTIQSNISLLPYNTFQIDVKAKYFVEIQSIEDLQELFQYPIFQSEKRLILGGWSNTLFTQDFDGLVIKVNLKGIETLSDDDSSTLLKVAAGENWSDFVNYTNVRELAGLENLIDIPGEVWTSAVSNIWAYGVEAKDRIVWVEGYDLQTGMFRRFSNEECQFSYRTSIFKSSLRNQFLISHVVFALDIFDESYQFITNYPDIQIALQKSPLPPFTKGGGLQHMSGIIAEIRSIKLPDWRVIGTAGSFFANPIVSLEFAKNLEQSYSDLKIYPYLDQVKLSAGQLIDKAGLKWYSNWKAWTSPQHALIVINEWGTAKDVLDVVEHIQTKVKEMFGVELVPEVVYE